eukprot:TRINITY_DN12953_c0_g1_i1.p1 TRINITY_DN12953_c0_g1~~TRINITY_DN12953_c0_g1_i1.p1  ORF type:complete len:177 (-),score=63.50 TRINITY_DN12953_c0_g1_i1:119-649(-)
MDHLLYTEVDPDSTLGKFQESKRVAASALRELTGAQNRTVDAKKMYNSKVLVRRSLAAEAKERESKADEALKAKRMRQEAEKAAQREAAATASQLSKEAFNRQSVLYRMRERQLSAQALRAEQTSEDALEMKQAFEADDSQTTERQIAEASLREKVAAEVQSLDLKQALCLSLIHI